MAKEGCGGPRAGKLQGGRTTPARHALQLDKVKLQTDRCRQSPAQRPAWPGLKFARALHALGGPEPANGLKRAPRVRPRGRLQRSLPPRTQRHPRKAEEWGAGEQGRVRLRAQLHTAAAPIPRCPHPPPLPSVPRRGARLHLPGAQSTRSSFNKNKPTHRPPHPHRAGSRATPSPPRRRRWVAGPRRHAGGAGDRARVGRRSSAQGRQQSPEWQGGAHGGGAARVNRFRAGSERRGGRRAGGPAGPDSPECAPAANAASGCCFSCRRSRWGCKHLSSSWCPWPRFP